jgi:hypothetical protein
MNDLITNGTEIKLRIISEITKAQNCIYIAVAWFTDRDIANAIISAKNRIEKVDIILSSNVNNEEVIKMLKSANISVHAFDTGDTRGLMHHKFCLFDNRISINGSFNFSYNASRNNVENIVVSDDTSLYTQFFAEFEQLKFNIDNQIAMNTIQQMPEIKIEPFKSINIIETFSQQLHNLLYSSSQINCEEYKLKGYETSKKTHGSIAIFKTEYDKIEEEIKALATDDSLSNKKSILTLNISNAFENTKVNLDEEKQLKISAAKKDNELEKRQIIDKISRIQQEKTILESGNQNTGEKGLLQLNKEIEKNKIETKVLEQSIAVRKFGTAGDIIVSFFLFVFACYLLVFFASALYKMLFESDVIRNSLEAGVNPGLPKLVDANAIIKIFKHQGSLFGFIGMIFFLFPVLLSNIKLIGSERKLVNNLLFWVGLFVFDVIVAGMIAINTNEIKCLLAGKESKIAIWEVIKHGEFWMIFMFGMVPLVITHYLIENITNAYKQSKSELVDAEKSKKIHVLEEEMISLNIDKESIVKKLNVKEDEIIECKARITSLETDINNTQNQIESRYTELQKQIKGIFDDFYARILSGKIFNDVILDKVITSYKSGFIEYLPEYYASEEVTNRVSEINQLINN